MVVRDDHGVAATPPRGTHPAARSSGTASRISGPTLSARCWLEPSLFGRACGNREEAASGVVV
jgi:hypothetical protein